MEEMTPDDCREYMNLLDKANRNYQGIRSDLLEKIIQTIEQVGVDPLQKQTLVSGSTLHKISRGESDKISDDTIKKFFRGMLN